MASVIWVPTRHNLSSLSSNKWSGLTLICETEPHSISEQRIRNAVSWMKWPVHVSGSGGSLGEKVVSPIKSKCNYVAIHFRKARTLLESRAETQTHRPNRPWRLSILPSAALVPSAEAADKKKRRLWLRPCWFRASSLLGKWMKTNDTTELQMNSTWQRHVHWWEPAGDTHNVLWLEDIFLSPAGITMRASCRLLWEEEKGCNEQKCYILRGGTGGKQVQVFLQK